MLAPLTLQGRRAGKDIDSEPVMWWPAQSSNPKLPLREGERNLLPHQVGCFAIRLAELAKAFTQPSCQNTAQSEIGVVVRNGSEFHPAGPGAIPGRHVLSEAKDGKGGGRDIQGTKHTGRLTL